jgi:hypothetical protein
METIVVGFGHKARNGKDEAVRTIIAERGHKDVAVPHRTYDIRRYAFADNLKLEYTLEVERIMREKGKTALDAQAELCIWASHMPVTNPDTLETKAVVVPFDPNPDMTDPHCPHGKQRFLLQWWGTEYRRWADSFYWVRSMAERIREEKPQFALISDMRFPNEAAWVSSNSSGFTANMKRLGFDNGLKHESETALDNWKYDYISSVMDGDLEALRHDALYIFDLIVEGLKVDTSDPAEPVMEIQPGIVVIDKPIKSVSWISSTPDGVTDVTGKEVAEILNA